jgi:hypothetical protein
VHDEGLGVILLKQLRMDPVSKFLKSCEKLRTGFSATFSPSYPLAWACITSLCSLDEELLDETGLTLTVGYLICHDPSGKTPRTSAPFGRFCGSCLYLSLSSIGGANERLRVCKAREVAEALALHFLVSFIA